MFELVEAIQQGAKIKVIGVGGGGGNAINTMISESLEGVEFLAANTDLQALKANTATTKIQLGRELTKGLGAGANPEVGRNAAIEAERELAEALMGADMIFVTAGMGGGTGTGAAPIVAKVAKECGALTVGVVTKPFAFEGKRRTRFAEEGINHLRDAVDTLITIPNEKLLSVAGHDMSVLDTFKIADDVLTQAVRGIANLITVHGLINLDFADVRAVMAEMGMAIMGTGVGIGENRAIDAATKAISSPLLENVSIKGATGLLINVTGSRDLTLHEVNEASKLIQEEADEDANIIFGAVIDENLDKEIRVTVIATGFNKTYRATRSGRREAGWAETPRRREQALDYRGEDVAEVREPVARESSEPTASASRDWGNLWDGTERSAASTRPMPPPAVAATPQHELSLGLQPVETRPVGATVRKPYVPDQEPKRLSKETLREIMDEYGLFKEQKDDQYDIPTFLRKQAD